MKESGLEREVTDKSVKEPTKSSEEYEISKKNEENFSKVC